MRRHDPTKKKDNDKDKYKDNDKDKDKDILRTPFRLVAFETFVQSYEKTWHDQKNYKDKYKDKDKDKDKDKYI